MGGRGGDVFFTRVHAMRDAPGRSDAGVAGPARPPVSIAGLHVRPPGGSQLRGRRTGSRDATALDPAQCRLCLDAWKTGRKNHIGYWKTGRKSHIGYCSAL